MWSGICELNFTVYVFLSLSSKIAIQCSARSYKTSTTLNMIGRLDRTVNLNCGCIHYGSQHMVPFHGDIIISIWLHRRSSVLVLSCCCVFHVDVKPSPTILLQSDVISWCRSGKFAAPHPERAIVHQLLTWRHRFSMQIFTDCLLFAMEQPLRPIARKRKVPRACYLFPAIP